MLDEPELTSARSPRPTRSTTCSRWAARPLLALSIAAFPEELPLETARAVLDAAAAKVAEAGAILAGGHTIRDVETKYGLAALGLVHPKGIWRKNGARPGDALFLTKPLGTGLVLTGVREGVVGAAERDAATRLDGGARTWAPPRRCAHSSRTRSPT